MKNLLIYILSAIFLMGCSVDESASELEIDASESGEEKALEIDVSKYFPPPVTRNQYRSPNDDGTDSTIISIAKHIVGEENVLNRILEETTYAYGNVSTQVIDYKVTESQIVTDSAIMLMNKSRWENDGYLFEILNEDAKVTVEAGEYKNVIVVKQTDIATNLKFFTYHAPNIGVIKIESDSPKFGEKLLLELVSTDFTAYGSNGGNEESSIDEITTQLENEERIETSPISRAASGKLPEKTGETSNINFNEYARLASEASMESLGVYLFHRPSSWEYEGTDVITYFDDNISLKSDENGMLKEVYFESEIGPGEEEFLISQSLLLGLSPNSSQELINEILFSGKEGVTYEFAGFEIGIVFTENSYKFLAVSN